MTHSIYGKNGVYKIWIDRSKSLVKTMDFAFYEIVKNSEHGDTKLVVSESIEIIVAETFSETKLQVLQRVEFSWYNNYLAKNRFSTRKKTF